MFSLGLNPILPAGVMNQNINFVWIFLISSNSSGDALMKISYKNIERYTENDEIYQCNGTQGIWFLTQLFYSKTLTVWIGINWFIICNEWVMTSQWFSWPLCTSFLSIVLPWQQGLWGQHGAHLGPTGPSQTPCWPHGPCYLGILDSVWTCITFAEFTMPV